MIQVARSSSSLVDAIVEKLVAHFQPRRIYLFGSRARGDAHRESDYDLLIEVDPESPAASTDRDRLIHLNDFPGVVVEVHVRRTGELAARKDDPGRVDWDVVREGIVLFAVDGVPAINPASSERLVRERFREPPASLAGWLERARGDMEVATYLASDYARWKDTICFHAQQAAEKCLKAVIIAQHKRPPRTHELSKLLQFLGQIGIDLRDVEEEAAFLTPFAWRTRYPDDPAITEADAKRALSAARKIERVARGHMG